MAKRVIVNVVLFLIVFLGLAFVLSNVQIKSRPIWCYLNSNIVIPGGQSYRMLREIEAQPKAGIDYILVGSSHAYRGYDPGYFEKQGVKLFNAGSSSQSLSSSLQILKFYREKYKRVILDVFTGSLTKLSPEEQLTLLQNTPNKDLAFNFFRLKTDFYSINNGLFRVLRMDETPRYAEEGYKGNGYVLSKKVLNQKIHAPVCSFDEVEIQRLIDIIQYCKSEGLEITLVSHPLPKPIDEVKDYWIFKAKLDSISNKLNVPFYDYAYRVNLDSSYFMDHNHLNEKGVDYFNTEFIKDKMRSTGWN